MVQTLETNDKNDLFLNSSGSITMLSGIDAVVTACKSACEVQLGECVLQQGLGLPNFQLVWVGTPDYAQWQSYLLNTLLNVDGVTAVSDITIRSQKNTLSYIAPIQTIYGNTTITGSIAR